MANFSQYNPSSDPSRSKGAFLAGGDPGYPGRVSAFNQWLYTPMDRRPTPTAAPAPSFNPGWNGPTQPVAPGSYSTPYGTASVSNPSFTPQPPAYGGVPMGLGAASGGSFGAPEEDSNIINTAPMATYSGTPSQPMNAQQRWSQQQPQGGLKPLSDARRFFWATGSIDARAPQANPQANKGAVSPVQFVNNPTSQIGSGGFQFSGGNGHSDWTAW